MNYQDMSGYEINARLHNFIECDNKYELKTEGYRVTWTDRETGEKIVTLRKEYDKSFKDYLGSWADAGPIIQGNRISVIEQGDRWCADGRGASPVYDKNPLHAAMIVFLMMKGGD